MTVATTDPIYRWYKAHQNHDEIEEELSYAKIVNSYIGFKHAPNPSYEELEKFDLRLVALCTLDDLFDGHI